MFFSDETIISDAREKWTNTCIEKNIPDFMIEYHVDCNVIETLSQKDFFASMTEKEIEEYIDRITMKKQGQLEPLSKKTIKEIKLRSALYHAREAQYYKEKEQSKKR